MTIMQLLVASGPTTSVDTTLSYIGSATGQNSTTLTYPTGTTSGDLIVAIYHGFSSGTGVVPSGFTYVTHTVTGDTYGYYKTIAYKIAGAETTVTMGELYFDQTILVFRNAGAVVQAHAFKYGVSGATMTSSYGASGVAILNCSDRGATGGYPSLGTAPDYTITGAFTYFYMKTGVYMNYAADTNLSYTDYNDVYGTNGILFVVTKQATKLTGITYSQSSTYSSNNPASSTYMNDNNANGTTNNNETGTNNETNPWIKADLGSTKYVNNIVIGYDYNSNLPGGWGPSYTNGLSVQVSTDNSTWTTVSTTPTYSGTGSTNGLVSMKVESNARYVRLTKASGFMATLEFQVWGY